MPVDEKLAERTKKILASFSIGPRKDVIDRYQESLSLKGDTTRGQAVYRRECQNCHKLKGEGHDVGPSLEIPVEWLPEGTTREQVADGLRPLLQLPVDVVLATHGGPTDRAALERALS